MPPKLTAKNPRPAFKPPRPVNTSNSSTTSKPPSTKPTRPPPSKAQPPRNSSASLSAASDADPVSHTRAVSSSSSSSDDDIGPPPIKSTTSHPAIPAKLLTRLLHEHFQSETRITREASEVVATYMETFVAEAIARAVQERRESGADEGFLEVEDLEKLAPQMLLDF